MATLNYRCYIGSHKNGGSTFGKRNRDEIVVCILASTEPAMRSMYSSLLARNKKWSRDRQPFSPQNSKATKQLCSLLSMEFIHGKRGLKPPSMPLVYVCGEQEETPGNDSNTLEDDYEVGSTAYIPKPKSRPVFRSADEAGTALPCTARRTQFV